MSTTASVVEEPKKGIWDGGNEPLKASWGKLMMWFFLLSDAFTFSAFLIAYGLARYQTPAFDETLIQVTDQRWPVPVVVFNAMPFLHGYDLPLVFVGIMTFILIVSSVTMVLAVEAGERMDQRDVEKWMFWTIIGGIAFLSCQAWEWIHFIHGTEGSTMVILNASGYFGQSAELLQGAVIQEGKIIIDNPANLQLLVRGATEPLMAGEALNLLQNADGKITAKAIEGANLVHNEYGPALFGDFFFFVTGFHGTHVLSGVVINIIVFYNVCLGTYQRRGHYEMVEKVGLYWHFVDLVWVFVFTLYYLI